MLSPADIDTLSNLLVTRAGGYLRNPIREAGVTCSVCTTPVDGYPRCLPCNEDLRVHGGQLADIVAPLTYAVGGDQAAYMMRGYKGRPPVPEHRLVVSILTWIGIARHVDCVGRLVGQPVTHWATVPSLPPKPGEHPFHRIIATNPPVPMEIALAGRPDVDSPRTAAPGHFVASSDLPGGSHVLVLDDTWTKGGHAQSAVLALRLVGAEKVSVLIVARWVNREYGKNGDFIRGRLTADYDPAICPWTGGACP